MNCFIHIFYSSNIYNTLKKLYGIIILLFNIIRQVQITLLFIGGLNYCVFAIRKYFVICLHTEISWTLLNLIYWQQSIETYVFYIYILRLIIIIE